MTKQKKAIYIEWVDSISTTGNVWVTTDSIKRQGIDRCTTIGFVVHEDKESVTVANSFDGQAFERQHVSGDMTIPKCAIRKRRVVGWKK